MSSKVLTLAIAMALVSNISPRTYQDSPYYGSHTYGSPIYGSLGYGSKTNGRPNFGSPNYGNPNYGSANHGIATDGRDVYERVMHNNGIDYYRHKVSFVQENWSKNISIVRISQNFCQAQSSPSSSSAG